MMWTAAEAPGLVLGDRTRRSAQGVRFGANVTVHEGTVVGDGCSDRRQRRARQAAGAVGPLDRTAGERWPLASAPSCASRPGRCCRRDRTLGDAASWATWPRCGSACTIGDGVVIGRGVCVENDTAIGAHTKIQTNAYITAVLHARGARLHRPVRRHHERQLHGPHRAPPRPEQGPDDPPRRPRRRSARRCCPGSRSARRRSSAPARSCIARRPGRAARGRRAGARPARRARRRAARA